MIAAMRLYPTPCRRRSIISLFCSSVIFSPYEKSGHPNIGMAAAVVMRFSDDLRIPSGNPADLIVNLYGVPAVDSGGDVVKRVACFRTSENRVLRPISGFGSFKASSAAVSDLCVLEP